MLPLGIFFRVFPFLRQAGATFIAIAIGFYIVMPMMYVMDMKVVERASGSDITFKNDPSWQQSTFGNNPNLGTYVTELTRIDPFNNVNNVAKLIPQAVFLPALNTVVVYAFMKSFAKLLTQRFPSPFE